MATEKFSLVIRPTTVVEAVYSDSGAGVLRAIGSVAIARASHVEPNGAGKWEADMSPSGGPVLGPFDLRQQAIDAELAWLKENRGL